MNRFEYLVGESDLKELGGGDAINGILNDDLAHILGDVDRETFLRSWTQDSNGDYQLVFERRKRVSYFSLLLSMLLPSGASDTIIYSPPGLRLWKLAEFLCTTKTYRSVFHPLLADFHHEYFELLSGGRIWKARWIRVLYFGAFFKSAGLNVTMKFLREAWTLFRKA